MESTMTIKKKAKQIAKLLRSERPDYFYLKEFTNNPLKKRSKSISLPFSCQGDIFESINRQLNTYI